MVTRRSNRTRGTRPDNMGRSLRARQMPLRKTNRVRGIDTGPSVTINQLTAGSCEYSGAATSCVAQSTYDFTASGFDGAFTQVWSILSGPATIVGPTDQLTATAETSASADVSFIIQVTVTQVSDPSIFVTDTYSATHTHTDLDLLDFRVTQNGDQRVTQNGDRRIING